MKWLIILINRTHNLTIALPCHIHLVSRVAYTFVRSLSVHTFRIGSTWRYVCPGALVDVIWTVITLPTRLKIAINTQNTVGFRQRRVNICNPKSPKAKGTSWTTMVSLQISPGSADSIVTTGTRASPCKAMDVVATTTKHKKTRLWTYLPWVSARKT